MKTFLAALGAIVMAIKDVLTPRLFFLALICFASVAALAFAAAWAAATFLPPLIPEGKGLLHIATRAAEIALSFGAGLLVIVFAPAVAMFVGGALFDVAAAKVDRAVGAPEARAMPLAEGLLGGLGVTAESLALNLIVLPALFIPPIFPIVFLAVNGWLFGFAFFTQAAVRHMSFAEAKALRRRAPLSVFLVGLVCSLIPFVAPLVGASAMARLVNALSNSGNGKTS
jgi:CysZ protein